MQLSTAEKERLNLKYGPWALVTGATSGIAEELANLLASAKFSLVLVGRNEDKLISLKRSFEAEYKVAVKTAVADLSQASESMRLLQIVDDLELGLFVGSAGYGTSGNFIHSPIKAEIGMVRINCEALMVLTHNFARRFAAQERGGIVLLSSLVAFQGVPYAANYSATKAYVQSLGEGLAAEMKPFNVDVLTAAPGPVKSGFGIRANMRMGVSLTPTQIGVPILSSLGRKSVIVPGLLSKILTYSLGTLPRWAKVQIMKRIMNGFTKQQR